MLIKDMDYKQKFEILRPWLPQIIEVVKKDLRQEHLKMDREFCKRYFLGKHAVHVTVPEMVSAYQQDIAQGNVGLAEFIASRWLLKNTDVYGFFEATLKDIHPDFEQIAELPLDVSQRLLEGSIAQYGGTRTYLFCVLNSVVFPEEIFQQLQLRAKEEFTTAPVQAPSAPAEELSLEFVQKRHSREVATLTDRYEKKMSGLQKKYQNDVETLKKQISLLQKKLTTRS